MAGIETRGNLAQILRGNEHYGIANQVGQAADR